MQFPFKRDETVRVEVIHPVVLCGAIQQSGFQADVLGRVAMQMMGHARPMVKLVEGIEPVHHEPVPSETPVEVADPTVETRDPAVQAENRPRPRKKASKKKAASRNGV